MEIAAKAHPTILVKDNPRIVNGWAMYDWANSVYSLVITSSIFPIFYENITSEQVSLFGRVYRNTALYSYTLSISFLVVALISPLLSGIADFTDSKKTFMKFFCYLGAISCVGLYFFSADHLVLGLIMVALAGIGFSGSQVFYNAFLPEIASKPEQDRVSAKGFSLGYIGSILLLIVNLAMIMYPEMFGLENNSTPARISFVMVGIWWIGFAQFSFNRLPPAGKIIGVRKDVIYSGYRELAKVWAQLRSTIRLRRYLMAFFVFNMGVQTVMYLAISFAKKEIVDMPDSGLIISILIIQLIAVIGAYAFSWLSARWGNIRALTLAVVIWIGVCYMAYLIHSPGEFYALAAIVGGVMGGIQALSRSTYSKLLPETVDHASYFSFYDVCDKLGIVFGTLSFGLIYEFTGDLRMSALAIGVYFVGGLFLLWRMPKTEHLAAVSE